MSSKFLTALIFFSVLVFFSFAHAYDMTSASFKIHDPIVGTGGGYQSSASFQEISAGNILGSKGGASSASFKANYGFLYYSSATTPTITFDIDAKSDFSNGVSAAPYRVHLGALSTGAVSESNGTSIERIVLNASTNSTTGVVVTVQNANGTNGLVSSAVSGDKIASATATMSAGTANYGLCVATSGLTSFTRAAAYVTTCAINSGTNGAVALSSTPANIVTTSASVIGAKAEVVVNAAISTSTKAHTDYGDTLTFIATSTY